MKPLFSVLLIALFIAGCQAPPPAPDNSAMEAFEKNCATVMSYLDAFQNENVDYSIFADDFVQLGTGQNAPDSSSVDDLKERYVKAFEKYDYKLLTDPLNLLPGVDVDSKKMNGSVRYYGDWEVTLSATDSTEASSAVLRGYGTYDFNEEGKIAMTAFYGDFGGLMDKIHGEYEEEGEETAEE